MPVLKVLTDKDIGALNDLLRRVKQLEGRLGNDVRDQDIQEQPSPEVYMARVPSGGLDAIAGDVPGVADCPVYRLIPDAGSGTSLEEVPGNSKTVYNATSLAFAEDDYVEVRRDKYGFWWASPTDFSTAIVTDRWLQPCRYATTVNISFAATGSRVIDGSPNMAGTAGIRILVWKQTTASQNGIYVTASDGSMSRASDMPTSFDAGGCAVKVETGTAAGPAIYQTVGFSVTTGSAAMVWIRTDRHLGGYGTAQIGPTFCTPDGRFHTFNRLTSWKASNSTLESFALEDTYIQQHLSTISQYESVGLEITTPQAIAAVAGTGLGRAHLGVQNTKISTDNDASLTLGPNDYTAFSFSFASGWARSPFYINASSSPSPLTGNRDFVSSVQAGVTLENPSTGAAIDVNWYMNLAIDPSTSAYRSMFSTPGAFMADRFATRDVLAAVHWGATGDDSAGTRFYNGIATIIGTTGPTAIDGGTF